VSAAALGRHLGDPRGDGAGSWSAALACDEAERFPEEAVAHLVDWGYPEWLVPEDEGGRLRSFDELLPLGRVVARRDLTLAIAMGQSLLGALPVWLAGDEAQRARLAARLRRGALGCLALTEEAHGGDLAATEVAATRAEGGWLLDGTKWCVNNATRGETLTVLARSDPAGGPRGFSLLLVEKDRAQGVRPHPRLRTHGLRGADISGAVFERAAVGEALVGREGMGLDIVLRTLQVSRTLCAAFSLGAADTALALAVDFARARRLYGATAWDIPVVRRTLLDAAVDLRAAATLARACARALSFLPGQMSVLSAVAKIVVPELAGRVIAACGVVLGARGYLREGDAAVFQKLARDHQVVPLFDGSTSVNLYVIAGQLERLATGGDPAAAAPLFSDAPAPAFARRALTASNRGEDDVLGSVGALAGPLAARVAAERDRNAAAARALAAAGAPQDGPERFAAARRYAFLAAAAACLHARLPAPAVHRLLGWEPLEPEEEIP
jgi:alkylation response protein AidB-like acyl-CoA dehydrogenase